MPPKKDSDDLEPLRDEWKAMFQKRLPEAAQSKSSAQPKWPVHVDHCFARIILDAVVGEEYSQKVGEDSKEEGPKPWMAYIKSPAYRNMSKTQLERALELGEGILEGKEDLVELDERSLHVRGKLSKRKGSGKIDAKVQRGLKDSLVKKEKEADEAAAGQEAGMEKKRKRNDDSDDAEKENEPAKKTAKASSPSSATLQASKSLSAASSTADPALLKKISASNKTDFQKSVLGLLLQIPSGHYTTYGIMSKHLSSAPRAVGNALRNNPFAPDVPCHRVLATGGGIGGFGGSWGRKGEAGKNDDEKRRLLRKEGVKFDGKGKVLGSAWSGFS